MTNIKVIARTRVAQSTLEYAVLISVVAAAVLAMQIYLKRGIAGRVRASTDQIGEQFSPGHTVYTHETTFDSTRQEDTNIGTATGGTGQGPWSVSRIVEGNERTVRTDPTPETTSVGLGQEQLYDTQGGAGGH